MRARTHTYMRDACCASLSRDSLGRYVENLNSGAEENFNHTTHLFGKVYDVITLPSLCYCNIWSGTGCGRQPQRVRWLHEESSVSRLGRYAVKNCNV